MACFAANEIANYWWKQGKSAQILFILPDRTEIEDVSNVLKSWGFKFRWGLYTLIDETPPAKENAMRMRFKNQKFAPNANAVFVLSTAGIAEDGWTIYINGVVDSGLMVNVDEMGFLHVTPATNISKNQRRGRAGRVTKPIKKQLKKARQRVDWASSSLQWMLFEDVLNYAKVHEGIADERRCQNRAHQLWDGECFTNQLYSVQGESATKAEVFLKWSRMGYDRAHCEQWWADGANLVKLDGKHGSVDEGWKKVRMAEMRSSR